MGALTDGSKVVDKEARKAAKAEKKCNKFIKKYEGCLKKGFKSNIGCGAGDGGDEEVEAGDKPTGWSKHEGKYLGGYSSGVAKYDTLAQAQAECVKRTDCGGITFETRGSKKFTLRKGTDLRDSPSAEISWKLSPKLSGAWSQIPGGLRVISKGKSGVWGVNANQNIYKLNTDGKSWTMIAGGLTQVASGAGVWVVNAGNDIYYRTETRGDPNSAGAGWIQVPGKLKWIASGKDIVVGVNANNDIFYRDGVSDAAPTGTKWVKINGKLSQIDVYDDEVVGTNPAQNIFRTPYNGAPPKPKPQTRPAPKPEAPAEELSKKELKKCGKLEKKLKKCGYEC